MCYILDEVFLSPLTHLSIYPIAIIMVATFDRRLSKSAGSLYIYTVFCLPTDYVGIDSYSYSWL